MSYKTLQTYNNNGEFKLPLIDTPFPIQSELSYQTLMENKVKKIKKEMKENFKENLGSFSLNASLNGCARCRGQSTYIEAVS